MNLDGHEAGPLFEEVGGYIGVAGFVILAILKEQARPLTFRELKNHPGASAHSENALIEAWGRIRTMGLIATVQID